MKISLDVYEFDKLSILVNGIFLSVLIVLSMFFVSNAKFGTIISSVLVITFSLIFKILWTSKAERILMNDKVKYWNTRRTVTYFAILFLCAIIGFITIVIYQNFEIAIAMILMFSFVLGASMGRMVKIIKRKNA